MSRWQSVRKAWREAHAANEERYRDSMDVLKDMFER